MTSPKTEKRGCAGSPVTSGAPRAPGAAWSLLLIILAGAVSYGNTLRVPFLFDDLTSIVNNPVVRDLGNFFLRDTGYTETSGRYVGYLTFALNYRLGGLDVTGYHLFNLAVHIVNALLLYALVLITVRAPFFRESREDGGCTALRGRWIALLAGLVFVAHPLQTQAVTYVVQRLTSLATLFFLLALLLYAASRENGGAVKKCVLYLASLASVLLAMKTKQNAFTLPAVIVLYEFLFFRGAAWRRLLRLVPFLATFLVIPLSLVGGARPGALGAVGAVVAEAGQVTQYKAALSRWEYLCTQFRVIVTYLRLLVFPANQNLDYDYPVHRSPDPQVLASLLLLLAIAGGALYLWRRSREREPELRLAAFGILYFFITLSVESSIIPITDVIYEHRVYLSSAGVFLAAAALLVSAATRLLGERERRVVFCCCAAAVALLCLLTVQRNRVWASPLTLWGDVVSKSPGKARGYNNLGAAYSEAGRSEEAFSLLQRALLLDPNDAEAHYNLGRLYLSLPTGSGEAIAAFKRALELKPEYPDAVVNLAAGYIRAGSPAETIRLITGMGSKGAGRADAVFNLGVAYAQTGEMAGALRQAAALRELDPRMAGQLENYLSQRMAAGAPGAAGGEARR